MAAAVRLVLYQENSLATTSKYSLNLIEKSGQVGRIFLFIEN